MPELERTLRALELAWPETPDVAGRLELAPRRRRRRLALAAAACAAAAVAAAFAVPQSRSAILRVLHLGGVSVVRVGTLPAAEERPLASGLGTPVGAAEAARFLGRPFLPPGRRRLYLNDGFVSTLLPGPVLLTEFGEPYLLKKIAGATGAEPVEVAPGVPGLWLGARHVVVFPGAPPRLAGDVLVWADGHVTYRLEAPSLGRDEAVRLARRILGTAAG